MTQSPSHDQPAHDDQSTATWTPEPDETRILSAADIDRARAGSAPFPTPPTPSPSPLLSPASFESGPASPPATSMRPASDLDGGPGPAANPDPSAYAAPSTGGYGAPAYSDATAVFEPVSGAQPYAPVTGSQTYAPVTGSQAYAPGSPPPYAPIAPPNLYAPGPMMVPPPPGVVPASGSRALAGVLSAVIGVVLAAAGCYLLFRFGREAYVMRGVQLDRMSSALVLRLALAGGGAVLLLGAVILNGWSPWATVLPGLVLAGLGTWGFLSLTGADNLDKWSNWLFKAHETQTWNITGATMALGAVLVASSVAAAIGRAAGKRSATPRL